MYWKVQIIEWSRKRKGRGGGGTGLEDMFLLFVWQDINNTWHDVAKSMTQYYVMLCYAVV